MIAGLLLLAVVLRGVVPPGFMPKHASDASGHGLYAMVICTSMGTKTVYVPADKAPQMPAPAPHAPGSASGACHFLSLGTDPSTPPAGNVISFAFQKTNIPSGASKTVPTPELAYIYHSRDPPSPG